MRYLLLIGDGIADRPVPLLNKQTPLSYLALPGMARLAAQRIGLVRTVPPQCPPGSDTAILSIFGCDPRSCFTGRAALESVGAGVSLKQGETAWRVNLVTVLGESFNAAVMHSHNGMGIGGEEALDTVRILFENPEFAACAAALHFTTHSSPSFRQIGISPSKGNWGKPLPGPHDHLGERIDALVPQGDIRTLVEASFQALSGRQANCIWPWAPGEAMCLERFDARYGHSGPVISAVPLVKGIAALCGLPAPDVEGATGELDTNYEGKVDAAIQGFLDGADFAAIHVEAPDECSHAKDVDGKLEALRRLDRRIILPLLAKLDVMREPYRILFLSDHPTLLENGAHDGEPVPFCLYDSRKADAALRVFSEENAGATGLYIGNGTQLMPMLFEQL